MLLNLLVCLETTVLTYFGKSLLNGIVFFLPIGIEGVRFAKMIGRLVRLLLHAVDVHAELTFIPSYAVFVGEVLLDVVGIALCECRVDVYIWIV